MKQVITTVYDCNAPKELFGAWEKVSQELRDQIPMPKGLACDGGGVPGSWCQGTITPCPWAACPVVVVSSERE